MVLCQEKEKIVFNMLLRLDCKFKRKEKHLFCRFQYTLQGLCLHYLFQVMQILQKILILKNSQKNKSFMF